MQLQYAKWYDSTAKNILSQRLVVNALVLALFFKAVFAFSSMANASVKLPDDGRNDRYYKYESIRIEWSIHFKNNFAQQVPIVQAFFQNFHQNHRGFQFVVAELFDGTTHVLVDSEKYLKIKEELEKITGKTLPDVTSYCAVKVKEKAKSFQGFQSHKNFSLSLKNWNDKIKAR